MFLRFICVVSIFLKNYWEMQHLILQIFHRMFSHFSIEGHLGYFQFLADINHIVMDILLNVLLWTRSSPSTASCLQPFPWTLSSATNIQEWNWSHLGNIWLVHAVLKNTCFFRRPASFVQRCKPGLTLVFLSGPSYFPLRAWRL